jgi:carbamate kinase
LVKVPVSLPRAVVALGGNALLRRGEPLSAANQAAAARESARLLGRATTSHRLIVTHGNGPQVGLLALMSETYREVDPYPLDVLGAESQGQIGYMIEMELDNSVDHQETAALITRTVVDRNDPAFESPTKFIGPVYDEAQARAAAERYGWAIRRDGERWRRVVPSPEPRRIVELDAIRSLVESGFLVVCTGGGGVPVVQGDDGRYEGVEAVIDKDLGSALLATDLDVDKLVIATDVDAVYEGYGTDREVAIARATPAGLRRREFPAGSMGPKVEAACRFVERTGREAVIGALEQVLEVLEGRSGTVIRADGPEIEYAPGRAPAGRVA